MAKVTVVQKHINNEAIVRQLRAEHVKVQRVMTEGQTGDMWNDYRCDVCYVAWPCPTARTIGAA